jgi:hypothetical protein
MLESVIPWTKDAEPPTVVVRLVLQRDEKETDIHVANNKGESIVWLATIGPKGLRRARDLPRCFDFPLDSRGRIKLDE